ncbi:unnamed protein product [Effrenium voratum]|nr:unnamed protein product [Effrenium voratum]
MGVRVNRNLLLEMETETSSGSSSSQEWSTGSPALEPELPQKVVKWSSTGSGKGKECTHPKPKAPGKGGKVPLLPHQMLQRELQERIDRGEISPIPHKGEVSHLLHPAPAKGKGKKKGEKGEKVASEESKENEEGKEKEGKENEEGKEKEPKGKGKGPKGPPLPAAKAAAAPSDTAPPKGTGKGPGKGGKGPTKGPPMAKAKAGFGSPAAKAKVGVKRLEGVAPLGKKIHWGAHYEEPHDESVFKSLNDGVSFNSELLKAMLSTDSESKPMARRKSMTKKPTGISILDGPRAQNLAIVMSKMKAPSASAGRGPIGTGAPLRLHPDAP